MIDFAFLPVDGPNHCRESFEEDKDERFQQGSDVLRGLLGIIVILFSLPASIALRLAVMMYPKWRWQNRQ